MDRSRDTTVDILRGLAIFLMVQGNMAGSLFPHPWPAWGDWYMAIGSFVPALFIMLAGMSVVLTTRKGYTLRHYLLRAGALLLTASLVVDLFIWGFVPFFTVDVLYLIAIALPLAYGFQFLDRWVRWSIIAVFFAGTPVLQMVLGYAPYPVEMPLAAFIAGAWSLVEPVAILKHWIVDGWFPIFPWLGFAFLGVELGRARWRMAGALRFSHPRTVLAGFVILTLGGALWLLHDWPLHVRGGFSEIIYPPTVAYLLTATGQIILLGALVERFAGWKALRPIDIFGRSALFMYWFHFGLIEVLPARPQLITLLIFFTCTLAAMLWLGFVLERIRQRFPTRPWWVRYVLGI